MVYKKETCGESVGLWMVRKRQEWKITSYHVLVTRMGIVGG